MPQTPRKTTLTTAINADARGFTKGMGQVRNELNKNRSRFRQYNRDLRSTATNTNLLSNATRGLGAAVAAGFSIRQLGGLINQVDELAKSARRVGVSAEDFQALQYAFQSLSIPVRGVTSGLTRFQTAIGELNLRSSTLRTTLTDLGQETLINLLQNAEDTSAAMRTLFRETQDLERSQRVAIFQASFGRQGAAFLQAQEELGGLDIIGDYLAETNRLISDEVANKLESIAQTLTNIAASLTALSATAIAQLATAGERGVEYLRTAYNAPGGREGFTFAAGVLGTSSFVNDALTLEIIDELNLGSAGYGSESVEDIKIAQAELDRIRNTPEGKRALRLRTTFQRIGGLLRANAAAGSVLGVAPAFLEFVDSFGYGRFDVDSKTNQYERSFRDLTNIGPYLDNSGQIDLSKLPSSVPGRTDQGFTLEDAIERTNQLAAFADEVLKYVGANAEGPVYSLSAAPDFSDPELKALINQFAASEDFINDIQGLRDTILDIQLPLLQEQFRRSDEAERQAKRLAEEDARRQGTQTLTADQIGRLGSGYDPLSSINAGEEAAYRIAKLVSDNAKAAARVEAIANLQRQEYQRRLSGYDPLSSISADDTAVQLAMMRENIAKTEEEAARAAEELRSFQSEIRAFGQSISENIVQGLRDGASAAEIFGSVLTQILDRIIQKAVTDPLGGLIANSLLTLGGGIVHGFSAPGTAGYINSPFPSGAYIPGLATGGRIAEGGLVRVGESGPELLALPKGAEVYPRGDLSGGMSPVINISVNGVQDPAIVRREVQRMLPEISRHATAETVRAARRPGPVRRGL